MIASMILTFAGVRSLYTSGFSACNFLTVRSSLERGLLLTSAFSLPFAVVEIAHFLRESHDFFARLLDGHSRKVLAAQKYAGVVVARFDADHFILSHQKLDRGIDVDGEVGIRRRMEIGAAVGSRRSVARRKRETKTQRRGAR